MSIHHEVTVHCDGCGYWEQGNPGGHGSSQITRHRRKTGWRIWREHGWGPWQHLCPTCNGTPAIVARFQHTIPEAT